MFSKDLEYTIGQCYKQARESRHEFMTVEHLLLALLENPSAAGVLRVCGADLGKLGTELKSIIAETVPVLPADDSRDTQPTLGFQRVLQRAVYHVQSSGRKEVTGANVLVALFSERDSHAVFFLQEQDITRLDVVNFLSHGIVKYGDFARSGVPGKGPVAVVTDMGILTPDPVTKELTLSSLHPGVTVEQAKAATGWDLRVANDIATTPPPTEAELTALRALQKRTAEAHGEVAA